LESQREGNNTKGEIEEIYSARAYENRIRFVGKITQKNCTHSPRGGGSILKKKERGHKRGASSEEVVI